MKVLRKGDRGEEVRTLQGLLHTAQDGVFGALTEEALKAWQNENGLFPDGICGPKTWAAVDQAMKDKDAQPAQKTYTVTIKGLSLDEADSLVMKYPDAVASAEGSD